MPRNVRAVGGRLAVGLAVAISGSVLPAGVASQAITCAPPAATTGPASPAGGSSGSVAQPGPAPVSPQACWTWSMDAYTMNADANEIVAIGDVIVTVAHDPELVALDATTGTERWRYPMSEEDYATVHGLAAADGVVFAGGMEGLDALDATDGTLLWRYPVDNTASPNPGWGGFFDPAVVGGSVYGTTRVDAADGTSAYTLVALDSSTGTPRWSVPISTETADPVASDGSIVALSYLTMVDGVRWPDLGAFDALTGAPLWVHEIRDVERWPSTRTIVADGRVFLGSQNGEVIALASTDGKRVWRKSVGHSTEGMTAGNGMLFVISAGEIQSHSRPRPASSDGTRLPARRTTSPRRRSPRWSMAGRSSSSRPPMTRVASCPRSTRRRASDCGAPMPDRPRRTRVPRSSRVAGSC